MKEKTFYLESLGCAKNSVDSRSMAQLLVKQGFDEVDRAGAAEVLVVNTCGFIRSAREESVREIRKLLSQKRKGQKIVVAGCLVDRDKQLVESLAGVDGILGARDWPSIGELVDYLRREAPAVPYAIPQSSTIREPGGVTRFALEGPSAYVKIADGCRRACAYCSIPMIKGSLVSRPAQEIVDEAVLLQEKGVKEIILIAQDTTDYGHDLGLKDGLADLIGQIQTAAPRIPWIRVLYAYPGYVTDRLIDALSAGAQLLPYLDIPLQHADEQVLRDMRRPANMDWVLRTVEKLRRNVPSIALRTTFIVGYPTEDEAAFQRLLDFVAEVRFDRVGTFRFSFEPGTASEALGDPVPEEVKEEREGRLMELQAGISLAKNQEFVGRTLNVLIEGTDGKLSLGRSYRDAPEIDGLVLVEGKVPVGEIVPVEITAATTYDLVGHMAKDQPRDTRRVPNPEALGLGE